MVNEFLYDVLSYRCEVGIKWKSEITKQNAYGAESLA